MFEPNFPTQNLFDTYFTKTIIFYGWELEKHTCWTHVVSWNCLVAGNRWRRWDLASMSMKLGILFIFCILFRIYPALTSLPIPAWSCARYRVLTLLWLRLPPYLFYMPGFSRVGCCMNVGFELGREGGLSFFNSGLRLLAVRFGSLVYGDLAWP